MRWHPNWERIPAVMAEWMAVQLGGKGNVILDRGLAGAPISAQLQEGYEAVLAKYPDIKVVGYYNGDYALGPEQSGVAALLAANPQVDGVLTQGYGSGAIQALQGRRPSDGAGRRLLLQRRRADLRPDRGRKCILGSNPAFLSSEAIKLAVEILDTGKTPGRALGSGGGRLRHHRSVRAPSSIPGTKMQTIEIGENAFPDQPPGLTLPITPDWVEITAEEAAGSK